MNWNRFPLIVDGAEVLLETALGYCKIRCGERSLQKLCMTLIINIIQRRSDPVLANFRVAFQREAVGQGVATSRVMYKDRIHTTLHRQDCLPATCIVGNAVLGLAGGVGIKHCRRLVVGEKIHGVFHEVALQSRVGLNHQHLRVEGGDQPEFLAIFLLATMSDTETGQV